MKKITLLLILLAAVASIQWRSEAQESGYQVIVNAGNSATSLSRSQVSGMLLKKIGRWPGSDLDAKPIDLDAGSPVREAFSQAIHKRSVSNIKNYWQRQIFSGRELPPPEVASDAAVVDFVSKSPGAIGYVSPGARLSGVKVLQVVD